MQWITKAANKGDEEGYYNIAAMYSKGDGVQKSLNKTKEYLKQGCIHQPQKSCEVYAELQKVRQSQ